MNALRCLRVPRNLGSRAHIQVQAILFIFPSICSAGGVQLRATVKRSPQPAFRDAKISL